MNRKISNKNFDFAQFRQVEAGKSAYNKNYLNVRTPRKAFFVEIIEARWHHASTGSAQAQ